MIPPRALAVLLLASALIGAEQTVTRGERLVEPGGWDLADANRTRGTVSWSAEGMRLAVEAPAGAAPLLVARSAPLAIPGRAREVRLTAALADPAVVAAMTLVDGWGRGEIDGKRLVWRLAAGEQTFAIPAEWVPPIAITGFSVDAGVNAAVTVRDLAVTTDLAGADPATGRPVGWTPDPHPAKGAKPVLAPLLSLRLAGTEVGNVYTSAAPAFLVDLLDWTSDAATGVEWSVSDDDGAAVIAPATLSVAAGARPRLAPAVERFGCFHLRARAASGPAIAAVDLHFAKLPPTRALSAEQKLASPYGLCVHGGRALLVTPFTKAGIWWLRDYAWGLDWLGRARDASGGYGGWPYFDRIWKAYEDNGVMLLPIIHGITPPTAAQVAAKSFGPDAAWRQQVAEVVAAFPRVSHWELANEYDLSHGGAEEPIGWANYGAYHRAFAEVVAGAGKAPVENGEAGINPERQRTLIASGAFDGIAVVNNHHYTGADAPEVNITNYNQSAAGRVGQGKQLYFDRLRDSVAAASSDGRPRQVWMTEYGYDTAAGPVVSRYLERCYLQRCCLLTLASGHAKAFWFFDIDSGHADNFFDGCGLLDQDWNPKPSLAAYAALTSILPTPIYRGEVWLGGDSWGYVFMQDGKQVAALWAVSNDEGPTVTVRAERLLDGLANPLPAGPVKLTRSPIFAVGLATDEPLTRQTAYALTSHRYLEAAAGDTVALSVRVSGDRAERIAGTLKPDLPAGWTLAGTLDYAVEPGKTVDLPLTLIIPGGAPFALVQPRIRALENGVETACLRLSLRVIPAVELTVAGPLGEPGAGVAKATVANRSRRALHGELSVAGAGWKAESKPVDLALAQAVEVELPVSWKRPAADEAPATMTFASPDGVTTSTVVPPGAITLTRAPAEAGLPTGTRVPWLGSTIAEGLPGPRAGSVAVRLGSAPDGLRIAVEANDSVVRVSEPRNFWNCDCLELFLEIDGEPHQFWFVPLPAEHRVFCGEWQRGDGPLKATRYDLAFPSAAEEDPVHGYRFEVTIPSAELGSALKPGLVTRGALTLSVHGANGTGEVFWPRSKAQGIGQPANWGRFLVE